MRSIARVTNLIATFVEKLKQYKRYRIYKICLLVAIVGLIWLHIVSLQGTVIRSVVIHHHLPSPQQLKLPPERGKLVSLCDSKLKGDHRTGNQLFMLAAMLHLANLTNRTLIMPRTGWRLDNNFELKVQRFQNASHEICPCLTIDAPRYDFDKRFDDPKFIAEMSNTNKTILFCGLSQTFKNARAIEKQLRDLLKFPSVVSNKAVNFLKQLGLNKTYINVGVHVRRGDFLQKQYWNTGLTVADADYFRSAFKYFIDRYSKVRFIVASDDVAWCKKHLPDFALTAPIHFTEKSQEVDLAILSLCDSVVISTGSYGWWGAWLANKTTVYYKDWARKGSNFEKEFNKNNYFIPEWIPR